MKDIETLFLQARELPESARASFLDQALPDDPVARERVEAMLRKADVAAGYFKDFPRPANPATTVHIQPEDQTPLAESEGSVIGRYKLLQQIGEGGCGTVFMAEQQEPVRRRVALKVIKLGMDTKSVVARFEAERQALALMDHPNIAKVLDAGATESGRPYFVMELVRGIRITDYCDQASLSTRERIDLFIQVCQAIQHAHQKGIIHRDIKPSNILVTLNDGVAVPKVIDFGIAKATQGRLTDATLFTAFEQFLGTPAYMSPEQAEMTSLDIDTRSDIYSLGVLLYELLSGSAPFDAKELMSQGLDAMRRTIREREPQRPSTKLATLQGDQLTTAARRRSTEISKLLHQLKGDLDWIVMKCLEKDRQRRYDTANGLAADLKRHLDNEPVVARPPSAVYKFQKAVRRNKLAFAAAAAVSIVLVLGVVISTWQATRANREARRAVAAEAVAQQRLSESEASKARALAAEKEATAKAAAERAAREESEAISKFMTEVLRSPDPSKDGREIKVVELLDKAAAKLESDLANQPARRAQLQIVFGLTYSGLGLFRQAIRLQEQARDYYLGTSGPEHPKTLAAISNLANTYGFAGRPVEALKMREELLALLRKVDGPEHENTLGAINNLAVSYGDVGRRDEALKMQEELLALLRKVLGPEHPATLRGMVNLASSYKFAGRLDEALKMQEEMLPLSRKVLGPEHPDTLIGMNNLALIYIEARRRDEALKLQEEVLALRRKVLGPEHPETLIGMNNLAMSYLAASRPMEATKLLSEAVSKSPDPTLPAITLASLQVWFGQNADYAITCARLLEFARNSKDPIAAERAAKICSLQPMDEPTREAALVLARRAVELGKEHPYRHFFRMSLGMAEYRCGHWAQADEALAAAASNMANEFLHTTDLYRAMSLFRQGRKEEALALFSAIEAKMKPMPFTVPAEVPRGDDLILGLAYKEARALLNSAPASKP